MDESGQHQGRILQSGDVVTLKGSVMAYVNKDGPAYIPAGTAAVVQRNGGPEGLVWVVFPELRDKQEFFVLAKQLTFIRSRYDGAGAGNDGGSPSSSQR